MPGNKKLGRGFRLLERETSSRRQASAESVHLVPSTPTTTPLEGESIREVPISSISPNPFQPRLNFDETGLDELVHSISATGLLQPIILRRSDSGHQIVVGHRRYLAAKRLGMASIPGIVREVSDSAMLEMALLENIQRKDLDPIEKARAFEKLETDFGLTHSEIGRRLGMNRSTVSNYIRLLELPEEILAHVSRGTLTMGHARALLAIESGAARLAMCHKIIREKVSVRDTEMQAAEAAHKGTGSAKHKRRQSKSAHLKELERRMQDCVGHKVTISQTAAGAGRITIRFRTTDEFNNIYDRLKRAFEGRPATSNTGAT